MNKDSHWVARHPTPPQGALSPVEMLRTRAVLYPRKASKTCIPATLILLRKQHTTTASEPTPHSPPPPTGSLRSPKQEGTIEDIFTSFHTSPPFPARFSDLKREIWTDGLVESWRQVLKELEVATSNVIAQGSKVSLLSISCIHRG